MHRVNGLVRMRRADDVTPDRPTDRKLATREFRRNDWYHGQLLRYADDNVGGVVIDLR